MIEKILLGLLGLFALVYTIVFIKDVKENKNRVKNEPGNMGVSGGIGFLTNFLDTLGIGSFAPTTALLRLFKQIDDRVLPGTLNVSCTLPVIAEAFLFIKGVKVEPLTLATMLIAAALGSYVGAGIVSKLPTKKVQLVMSIALGITAIIMLFQQFGLFPLGGSEIGLSGGKLVIAIAANFILGALMTAGIGLYAPCMALVYLLGMSPKVAFPIMMGSCAFLMPVASIKFIREGAYSIKNSVPIAIGGLIGVAVAYIFFQSLPMNILTWLVIAVVTYTAVTLFMSATKRQDQEERDSIREDFANNKELS